MPAPAKKPAASAAKSSAKPAAIKPAAKSAAAVPRAAPAVVPAVVSAKAAAAPKTVLSPAERMKMIAETAYYLAQKRGFTGGNELTDWVAAEKQVDTLVAKRS